MFSPDAKARLFQDTALSASSVAQYMSLRMPQAGTLIASSDLVAARGRPFAHFGGQGSVSDGAASVSARANCSLTTLGTGRTSLALDESAVAVRHGEARRSAALKLVKARRVW